MNKKILEEKQSQLWGLVGKQLISSVIGLCGYMTFFCSFWLKEMEKALGFNSLRRDNNTDKKPTKISFKSKANILF